MILTLTANPSLDHTIEVEQLRRGAVHRAVSSRLDPGGKGVNVSRALAANGISTIAVLPAGGARGAQLADLLAPVGVPVIGIPIAAPIRSNVTLVDGEGVTTKINEAGPTLTPDEIEAMVARVATFAESAEWVVLSGSLPPGIPSHFYADLVARVHRAGRKVALDTSGTALAEAIGEGPDLIKPNAEELGELSGRALVTLGDVRDEARRLLDRGVGAVLTSLGGDGALLVDATGVFRAQQPAAVVRSTVGAGDCALAGFLAGGATGSSALRLAVAYGTAAVELPGSAVPGPGDITAEHVTVEERPDLDVVLEGDPS